MLARTIEGKTLVGVEALSGKLKRKGITGIELFYAFLPSKVNEVRVKGKSLLIMLESGACIHSTLGMAGWWYPVMSSQELLGKAYANGLMRDIKEVIEQAYKHSRVGLFTAEDGPSAVFCDMRNFGNMTLYTPDQLKISNPLDKLGIDLLNEAPYFQEWISMWEFKRIKATKGQLNKKIGELLLDQEFACGLGNIYRAEVLYSACINPLRRLGELTQDEWARIGSSAPFILGMAYTTQGSMNYPGWFLQGYLGFHVADDYTYKKHLVYGRKTDPIGREITTEIVGGRTMWYCPEIQL